MQLLLLFNFVGLRIIFYYHYLKAKTENPRRGAGSVLCYLAAVRVGLRRRPLVVDEHWGLWAKHKMQRRQMKCLHDRCFKRRASDTLCYTTPDRFSVKETFVSRGHNIVMLQTPTHTHTAAQTSDGVVQLNIPCTFSLHMLSIEI